MNIRPMRDADIPEGLRLCRASNWNQLEDDWRFFLQHGGGLLAEIDGAIAGSVAYLPFGAEFGWVSMMLVDPAQRRSGIGSQLMETALELTPNCVRLDATPSGEPLYRRYGFTGETELLRTKVAGSAERFHPSPRVRAMQPDDLPGIYARDRAVFEADRSALLSDLYRRGPGLAWVAGDAYCFGRPGYLYHQLGPVVAGEAATARELVEHCLSLQDGRTFALDVPRQSDPFGFPVERPFLRMCRGGDNPYCMSKNVFAIAGPEFG